MSSAKKPDNAQFEFHFFNRKKCDFRNCKKTYWGWKPFCTTHSGSERRINARAEGLLSQLPRSVVVEMYENRKVNCEAAVHFLTLAIDKLKQGERHIRRKVHAYNGGQRKLLKFKREPEPVKRIGTRIPTNKRRPPTPENDRKATTN